MARPSQCSSLGDDPLDPSYLPPHYREEYRLAIDALVEHGLEGYYDFLQRTDTVDFLSRTEVEQIMCIMQDSRRSDQPELLGPEAEDNGSSDTYWPLRSDLDAPGLELGWPSHHSFIGPTEVTTLVNPPDPNMPSIKEQARRLIKNAKHVIGVVMDLFTDVDIFGDLLDATRRHVPVYILLDEQNAHHFTAMVTSCKVNLDMVQLMRIRTVSGTTYLCRTGKSFKGQMMDRFLLVDCRAVLGGNYCFMWSFEKIHRCIAHLFLGELVTTFDEEFRVLYAQSQPLVMEHALVPLVGNTSYCGWQNRSSTAPLFRKSIGYMQLDDPRNAEPSGHSIGDRFNLDRHTLPFRRKDVVHSSLEPDALQLHSNHYYSEQFRMDRLVREQGRSIMASRQMEMTANKRHSYAEGTQESYSSSQHLMKHRVMSNLELLEAQSSHCQREQHYYHGGGPGSGHVVYDAIRSPGFCQTDQYSESVIPPELEIPSNYGRIEDYSDSSREMRLGYGQILPAGEWRYSQANMRRASVGQPYTCQTSPEPLHAPDQKHLFTESSLDRQPQDPSEMKQGLRKWRINSFLSALEDTSELGLPQPLGPDTFDEPIQPAEGKQYGPETSLPRFSTIDHTQISPAKQDFIPHYCKSVLPKVSKDLSGDLAPTKTESRITTVGAVGQMVTTTGDSTDKVKLREPKELSITQHESFRSRLNPLLQRSSRLRSSLIFSSSNFEQHFSQEAKPSLGLDAKETSNDERENDPLKTSIIVSQILEKRRPRELFDWSSHKRSEALKAPSVNSKKSEESTNVLASKQILDNPEEVGQPKAAPGNKTEIDTVVNPPKPLTCEKLTKNMNESRPLNFKELECKQKISKTEIKSADTSPKCAVKQPFLSRTSPDGSLKIPVGSITVAELPMNVLNVSENKSQTLIKETTFSPGSISAELAFENPEISQIPPDLLKGISEVTKNIESVHKSPESTLKNISETLSDVPLKMSVASVTVAKPTSKIPQVLENLPETVIKETAISPGSISVEQTSKNPEISQIPAELTELAKEILSADLRTEPSLQKTNFSETQPDGSPKMPAVMLTIADSPVKMCNVSQNPPKTIINESSISPGTIHVEQALKKPEISQTPPEPVTQVPGVTVEPSHIKEDSQTVVYKELKTGAAVAKREQGHFEPSPSSKCFYADGLKHVTEHTHNISCENEQLRDATDAEKKEWKSRGCSSSSVAKEALLKSNESKFSTSLVDGSGQAKQDAKAREFLKKQTQKLKGLLSPKGDKKVSMEVSSVVTEEKTPTQTKVTVSERSEDIICGTIQEDNARVTKSKQKDVVHNPLPVASKVIPSRYQTSTANILSSSNLKDDTKVILEQISASSQNRIEQAKKAMGNTDDPKEGVGADKSEESSATHQSRNWFQHPKSSPQERANLLKKIENMRKEKKVYSRFEMGS